MSQETILSLLLSVPIGIIGGLYAGIVVARYQRFADLRLQAKKIILEIDFISNDTQIFFPQRKETPELVIIASDLLFLGHREAGEAILQLNKDIQQAIGQASSGHINSKNFNDIYTNWQHQIRSITPSTWKIIKIWGGL